jgi:hypothetical protein
MLSRDTGDPMRARQNAAAQNAPVHSPDDLDNED